jgi:hypothetical protein
MHSLALACINGTEHAAVAPSTFVSTSLAVAGAVGLAVYAAAGMLGPAAARPARTIALPVAVCGWVGAALSWWIGA